MALDLHSKGGMSGRFRSSSSPCWLSRLTWLGISTLAVFMLSVVDQSGGLRKAWIGRSPDSLSAVSPSAGPEDLVPVRDPCRSGGDEFVPKKFTPQAEGSIYDAIYVEKLVNEFKSAYENKFGHFEAERQLYGVSRYQTQTETVANASFITQSEDLQRRKEFGHYMLLRLSEYHIDNYARKDPNLRKALELKERLSQAKVEMRPGYVVNLNYRLSANRLDIRFVNPFVHSELLWYLGESDEKGGPAVIVTLGYPISPQVRVRSYFKTQEREWALVGEKDYGPSTTASLTALTRDETSLLPDDNQLIAGLAWRY